MDGVLIGVMQDSFRGLVFQPAPVFILLIDHFFVKSHIQIVDIYVITPPHAASVSCLYRVAALGVSDDLIPKGMCF